MNVKKKLTVSLYFYFKMKANTDNGKYELIRMVNGKYVRYIRRD